MKKVLTLAALILSSTGAMAADKFLSNNPMASKTIHNPQSAAICIAANTVIASNPSVNKTNSDKINAMNSLIWFYVDSVDKKHGDKVEMLLPTFVGNYKRMPLDYMLAQQKNAGCPNLNSSIITTFNL
ncbi:hypothetical protein [Vibrio splendidus]|uniref:hypothetical protein n=1 Tax=Vibrio splendidus TaxID=29497 RepID=UPI000C8389AB|nr:hypothetical protein [Vibrio splendidus]PMH03393.1 hypothetical protein BCU75_23690 [Vibrio splendidus]